MIRKTLPGFSFSEPTIRVLDIRIESRIVVGDTRAIRAIWTPELAQDLLAFQNINAEDELTALLSEHMRAEVDNQIIRDLRTRGWGDLFDHNRLLFNNIPTNEMDGVLLPISRRVIPRTIASDLIATQPLLYLEQNYNTLPNEEGWYTNDTWESILINMYLKPHKFIEKIRRNRRNR